MIPDRQNSGRAGGAWPADGCVRDRALDHASMDTDCGIGGKSGTRTGDKTESKSGDEQVDELREEPGDVDAFDIWRSKVSFSGASTRVSMPTGLGVVWRFRPRIFEPFSAQSARRSHSTVRVFRLRRRFSGGAPPRLATLSGSSSMRTTRSMHRKTTNISCPSCVSLQGKPSVSRKHDQSHGFWGVPAMTVSMETMHATIARRTVHSMSRCAMVAGRSR
mmetsp:Transcript_102628/g.290593  ORF Transcript_102628/g.290593 Transcript_102628/m.290593 type:complete len:219 (+) Transcript_102628:79-735(+)